MEKQKVDPKKYDLLEINRVKGTPWPRLPSSFVPGETINVQLKDDYEIHKMDYLDTVEARPIFEKQAEHIIRNNIKGIVDIGCRIGIMNNILQEKGYTDYQYMGFDTSPQPVNYAKEVWQQYPNIEFRCASMYDKENIAVDFDVDCTIWGGVLIYDPDNHIQLFNDLTVDFYGADYSIICEPCAEQDESKYLPNMDLHTIEQELYKYKEKYSHYEESIVDANIFCGKRKIAFIHTNG